MPQCGCALLFVIWMVTAAASGDIIAQFLLYTCISLAVIVGLLTLFLPKGQHSQNKSAGQPLGVANEKKKDVQGKVVYAKKVVQYRNGKRVEIRPTNKKALRFRVKEED